MAEAIAPTPNRTSCHRNSCHENSPRTFVSTDKSEVFADGFLDADTGLYRGRPVDVAQMKDGSLLISDDFAGAIYRVTYSAP